MSLPRGKKDGPEDTTYYFYWLIAALVLIFFIGQVVGCEGRF
jgi:hypothetical protein